MSRGYQRFFADGERVQLIDKVAHPQRRRVRPAGTADVFVRSHFNSYRDGDTVDDALEDEWARLEQGSLPHLRAWVNGNPTNESRQHAKVIAALHFARSFALRSVLDRIIDDTRAEAIANMPTSPEAIAAWMADNGTEPAPGEFEAVIADYFDVALGHRSPFPLERMADAHNQAIDLLRDLHVQQVTAGPDTSGFVLADSPFVYFTREPHLRVGGSNVALGDATAMFLPIAPHLGAFFTSSPEPDVEADPGQVCELNALTWRSAQAQLIAHPGTDLHAALAGTGWLNQPPRNAPCPCGSGQKAKRCCGRPEGLTDRFPAGRPSGN